MIYAVVGDNALLYDTTDVIDTYVYRISVRTAIWECPLPSVYSSHLLDLSWYLVQTLSLRRLTLTLQCSKKGKENRYEGKWKENKNRKRYNPDEYHFGDHHWRILCFVLGSVYYDDWLKLRDRI